MQDNFYINLSECDFGPEELELLLKEWQKDPKPKTIKELARIYLTLRYETETGFLPYDSRKPYKVKDKIKIRTSDGRSTPAEVMSYVRNTHVDPEGCKWDSMDVRLLIKEAELAGKEIRRFVANYQGNEFHAFVNFEIIREKDVTDIIPKLSSELKNDKRFVNFREYWLPVETLISDISNKIHDVESIITKSKRPLSTREIIEELYANGNGEELNKLWEFSLNYFLERDKNKRFIQVHVPDIKWDLRKPPPQKTRWTVTVKPEWLEKNILIVPRKLSDLIEEEETIHVLYDQIDELLPYSNNDRLIKGLDNYYTTKAIAEWDKVNLRLQGIGPATLFLNCRWQRRIDRLLKKEPEDLSFEHISLRDCIIIVLSKFKTPAHYREIYSEIADHKDVLPITISATLSRYSPSVFAHVCRNKWTLTGWAEPEKYLSDVELKDKKDDVEISKEVWDAVETIEKKDYVYKILKIVKNPLSFDEICKRLAKYLRVDVNQLRATGFLKHDERLRRLDNGTWALEEWFAHDDSMENNLEDKKAEHEVKEVAPEDVIKSNQFWLVLIILLIIIYLCIIASAVLILLFIYWR